MRIDRRHDSVLFPFAATHRGEFDRVIAIVVVAEQEVAERSANSRISTEKCAVEDQNAVGVQKERIKSEAVRQRRIRVERWTDNDIHIFRSKSPVVAAPHAVKDYSVRFDIPKAAAQPSASAFDRRELRPETAKV